VLRDLDGLPPADVHRLLTQVIVPRPIAWVVTDAGPEARGRWNLAPFSYFMGLASDPPLVGFAVAPGPAGRVKDTRVNLDRCAELTVLLPHRGQLEAVHRTSSELPPGESELEDAGLTPVTWEWPVPRVAGARVALGCRRERLVGLDPADRTVLVVARVHRVWLDDAVVTEDRSGGPRIAPGGLDPLARLGSGLYAGLGDPVRPAGSAGRAPR
jgi:flavin reductase (DIM6/NTAB) family NADH-FMN oxidoreductase RutF